MEKLLVFVFSFAAILQLAFGVGALKPNYITEEEFAFARKNPIRVNNFTAPLELPPYGTEGVSWSFS